MGLAGVSIGAPEQDPADDQAPPGEDWLDALDDLVVDFIEDVIEGDY